ncbi:tyrosine-type recombinase/integrase [Novosphingobium sp. YJ-S2-02]|uniref:Tyrosine-type recombinase/integrase n=1 Tax=Novosphingobium aureum TaxID=2792964 RepID=A0A931HD84_9SPHN|nr:integrase arm-type DNA-binding domain-containing protein [Novosphingobium aureum]MBH0113279.1 tyrosine-type recombinase/integrase [Novosphingobium aureum]
MKADLVYRNAKPREKAYNISDGGGLHLLILPSGRKTWRIAYRYAGQQRTQSIGDYPEVGPREARSHLLGIKVLLDKGADPKLVERSRGAGADLARAAVEASSAPTFRAVAEEWYANWKLGRTKPYAALVKNRLETHVYPTIGDKPIDTIRAPEILALLRTVEGTGALEMSRRLRQTCDQVFRYGFALGLVETNPASNALVQAMKPRPKVRHHPSIPAAELPNFLEQCRTKSGAGELTYLAILFTTLTWARTTETREATWAEFEGDLWRVPPERMKMKREHLVPLSRQAQQVVARLREISESDRWVFPSDRNPLRPASQNMMLYVCYRLGYRGRLTIHGLRGSASTWANETGLYNSDWIEMALAHSENDSVRAAYNSAVYLPQRQKMLQDWADFLDGDEFDELLA